MCQSAYTNGCSHSKFSLYTPEYTHTHTHTTYLVLYISHSKWPPLFNMIYYWIYHSHSFPKPFPLCVQQHEAAIATDKARPFERLHHGEEWNTSHGYYGSQSTAGVDWQALMDWCHAGKWSNKAIRKEPLYLFTLLLSLTRLRLSFLIRWVQC